VVNASGFSATAQDVNAFMFGGGPVRRYVGEGKRAPERIVGVNVVPGGPSGIPGDPHYAKQLGAWLTADQYPVDTTPIVPGAVTEKPVPPAAP
jgi:acyl-homoserine lactone acylase PvdQ